MRRLLPLLIAGAALAAGCSDRPRLNPLDPGNPSTGGRPADFVALADDGAVVLRWTPAGSGDVAGYVISRRDAPDSAYRTLATLNSPQLGTLLDTGLLNGVEVGYRLQYRFTDGRLSQAATNLATPGPLRVWITDYAQPALLRVTPDTRHVADRSYALFRGPTDVDVEPSTGLVWACDPNYSRVVIHNPGSLIPRVVPGLVEPVAVAVDPADGHAWICDLRQGALLRIDPARIDVPEVHVDSLEDPLSVAVDPVDGSVWVCENTGGRVRHFARDGSALGTSLVAQPSRVAVDSLTRSVWVTSFSQRRVVRISADGVVRDTIPGFSGPIGVAVDPRSGTIWVADAYAGRLYAYDRFGDFVRVVNGLTEVREIAVDRATGEVWVTLPGPGQVVRLSATGAILARLPGLGQPIDIAVHGF